MAGSRKGVPNKSTARVRAAISKFVESHIDDYVSWLEDIAKEDKKAAADLFLKTIEYHIPKLARTELTGLDEGPLEVAVITYKREEDNK